MLRRYIGARGTQSDRRSPKGFRVGLQIGIAPTRCFELDHPLCGDLGIRIDDDPRIDIIGFKAAISAGTRNRATGDEFHLVAIVEDVAGNRGQIACNEGACGSAIAGRGDICIQTKADLGRKIDRGLNLGAGA